MTRAPKTLCGLVYCNQKDQIKLPPTYFVGQVLELTLKPEKYIAVLMFCCLLDVTHLRKKDNI